MRYHILTGGVYFDLRFDVSGTLLIQTNVFIKISTSYDKINRHPFLHQDQPGSPIKPFQGLSFHQCFLKIITLPKAPQIQEYLCYASLLQTLWILVRHPGLRHKTGRQLPHRGPQFFGIFNTSFRKTFCFSFRPFDPHLSPRLHNKGCVPVSGQTLRSLLL